MKFGQNLEQYSVPQWAPYNLDYDNVKRLIRIATLPGSSRAIEVPGSSSDTELAEGSEQELYLALTEELERVELFSKTKYGEIQRRLEHHEKLLEKLNSKNTKISGKRLQRLAKLEEGVVKAGQDLQLLSRFIGANRLAFVKLLKKYKKWSGSVKLVQQFRQNQLNRCEFLSELKDPLNVLLTRYTRLLESVRAPFDAKHRESFILPQESSRKTHILHRLFENGTQTDFDSEFMTSATSEGGRATYWVHDDNLIQIHILLQSVSNQRRPSSADTPTSPLKATTNPLNTFGDNFDGSGMIVFGNPNSIADISGSEDELAYVHYTKSDRAITLKLPDTRFTLKRKEVALLLQTDYVISADSNTNAIDSARSWFGTHPRVKPLVEIGYSRTRFAGISNTKAGGVWAVLDEHVVFAKPGRGSQHLNFPHAILDIRWEGQTPDIVKTLDRQAIAERVQGFDMRTHALATIYPETSQPAWFKMLTNELRKMPDTETPHSESAAKAKESSATTTSDQSYTFSTSQNYSSATSTNEISDLVETARRTRQKRLRLQTPIDVAKESQVRYWNEFDDGDEEMQSPRRSPTETYQVEEDVLVSMFRAVGRKFKSMAASVGLVQKERDPEQEPLLSPATSLSSRSLENGTLRSTMHRNYNAIAEGEDDDNDATCCGYFAECCLIGVTWIIYAMALAFLALAWLEDALGRFKRPDLDPKARGPITFSVLMSFLVASVAAMCGHQGIQGRSVVGRSIVRLFFGVLCVVDLYFLLRTWF